MEIESHFSRIVELTSEAIFVLNENFIIEYANSAAVIMIGDSAKNILGTDFREYVKHQPDVLDFLESDHQGRGEMNIICYEKEIVEFGLQGVYFSSRSEP